MYPGDLLHSLLCAHPGVSALAGDRVYPVRVPQGKAMPAVAYQQVGGTGAACQSYGRFRYQLSAFADTYTAVTALSAAIEAALNGYEQGEIYIEVDTPAIDQHSDSTDRYFRTQDFFIEFPNPLPS